MKKSSYVDALVAFGALLFHASAEAQTPDLFGWQAPHGSPISGPSNTTYADCVDYHLGTSGADVSVWVNRCSYAVNIVFWTDGKNLALGGVLGGACVGRHPPLCGDTVNAKARETAFPFSGSVHWGACKYPDAPIGYNNFQSYGCPTDKTPPSEKANGLESFNNGKTAVTSALQKTQQTAARAIKPQACTWQPAPDKPPGTMYCLPTPQAPQAVSVVTVAPAPLATSRQRQSTVPESYFGKLNECLVGYGNSETHTLANHCGFDVTVMYFAPNCNGCTAVLRDGGTFVTQDLDWEATCPAPITPTLSGSRLQWSCANHQMP